MKDARGARPERRRARSEFVGRAAELRQILRLLPSTRHHAQTVVIRGAAGIGKTRLAEEVAARARGRGSRVGVGWCWQDGEAPPLWPWRAILRDLEMAEDGLDEAPGPARRGRFARFLAVAEHLRAATRAAPVVIVLDDVHLADPATLQLARFVASEGRLLPLLLVLTHRDDTPGLDRETGELLAELAHGATTVALCGLSEGDVSAYICGAGGDRPEPELLRAVTAVTKGNPLHLRSVTAQSRIEAGGLAGGLEHALEGLLAQLSAAERRLVALAALLGTEASVHEVALVAWVSPSEATAALGRAAALGLVAEGGSGRFPFVHELLRRSAAASLSIAERLDAHMRAAALLVGPEPQRLARRAHHALAGAARSGADAEIAVRIAREAAGALRAVDGYEAAAALLERATEVHLAAVLASPAAGLAVERAEAVLACGRLADARALFHHAARQAETEGDAEALARAALGLGGLWVREHRLWDEAERVRALQRRALQHLPAEATVLRARLVVRLAVEESYRGGSLGPVIGAVEAARQAGDAHALAEALSLCHHAHMVPEHAAARLPWANELIAVGATAGDGLLGLMGLCWRAADLFLLGAPGAEAALAELRTRADALRCRSILFMARVMEVMLAIRTGDFDRAEDEAAACFELGTQVGDADALAYHGAHLIAIRSFQGRDAELAELMTRIAASPTLIEEGARAFSLTAALLSLRAGRPEAAREALARLAREGLQSLPASSSWTTSLLVVIELAAALGDAGVARAAYQALLPYAARPVMASLACVCFGSAHRLLGLAAQAAGQLDLAIEHFGAAVTANERLGHRPAAIQARADLGLAHLRRGQKDDVGRGRGLLRRALAAGEAAGMMGLAARWREAQAEVEARRARPPVEPVRMSLEENGRWRVAWEGQSAVVPDRLGMRYLARLVEVPDRVVPALALVANGTEEAVAGRGQPVIDRQALAALRRRIREIEQQPASGLEEQEELAALRQDLGRAIGLNGRIRSFADAPERARTAVRKAIKRALDEIAASNPALSRHLAQHVETGTACCYRLASAGAAEAAP
jgi:hypothetical protein